MTSRRNRMIVTLVGVVILTSGSLAMSGAEVDLERFVTMIECLRSVLKLSRLYVACGDLNDIRWRRVWFNHLHGITILPVSNLSQIESGQSVIICDPILAAQQAAQLVASSQPLVIVVGNEDKEKEFKSLLDVRINQRVYIFNLASLQLLDFYRINNVTVDNQIGSLFWEGSDEKVCKFIKKQSVSQNQRSNLHGVTLRALVETQAPYIMYESHDDKETTIISTPSGDKLIPISSSSISGLFKRVVDTMQVELNFTIEFYKRQDGIWGGATTRGGWTGMVSTLVKGEADLIATSFTLTPQRFGGVDYLWPIGKETYATFIKRSDDTEQLDWKTFFSPFSNRVWLTIVVASIVLGVIVKSFELILSRCKWSHQDLSHFILYPFLLLLTIFGRPLPKVRRGRSQKASQGLLQFSILFTANVIFMVYRASLTSELSDRTPRQPFSSLHDLLHMNYDLLTRSGGATEMLFTNSTDGIYYELNNKLVVGKQEEVMIPSVDLAMQKLMMMPRAVYFYVLESVYGSEKYKCLVKTPWISQFPGLLGMAVPKNSPYFEQFQNFLLRHIESGNVKKISLEWIKGVPYCPQQTSVALGMEKLVTLFAIFFSGVFTALMLLLLESVQKLASSCKHQRKTTTIELTQ